MKFCIIKNRFMLTATALLLLMFFVIPAAASETAGQNQVKPGVNQTGSKTGTGSSTANINVKLNKRKVVVKKDRSEKLKAIKKNAASRKIIWSSSNRSIAKVNKYGLVTGKDGGKAIVTARVQGTDVKAACRVEVQNYKVMRMRTTGYCNCRRCAGKWAGQPTASGRMPRANHTIAVDKRLIRLGTKVQIGNKVYTAEDTGGAIKGHRIDIYYSSHRKATRHGVKYQLVKVFY